MSTHSGAINSLAAATTHDLYLPITAPAARRPAVAPRRDACSRSSGASCSPAARCCIGSKGTPVVAVALAIASFTYGGLLGGFFLGLWWRRALQRDAITGMAVGIAAMSLVVFARQIAALVPALAHRSSRRSAAIAWPWYVFIGTTITLATGIAVVADHMPPGVRAARSERRMTRIVVGVDGGGSRTRVIVADEQGTELARAEGDPSADAARRCRASPRP